MSPPPPSLTSAAFSDPFRFLDAKLFEFKTQRSAARDALKSYGWILRPNHPLTGVWRARRWTREGTLRLTASAMDELVSLAKTECELRQAAKAAKLERKKVAL